MKRSKLKLNRETLATLDSRRLRAAGGDCTCQTCQSCCPTCAYSCTCPPGSETCFTDTCTQDNQSNCICA